MALWPPLAPAWTVNDAIIQMFIMNFVYILLYFYLEEVIPNEYGVAKSPLFFLDIFKKKRKLPNRASRSSIFDNKSAKVMELESDASKLKEYSFFLIL